MGEKLKPFTREQSRELEKVLPPDTPVQDLIDAFKDLISRESSHEKDLNGPGLESRTTQALARSQLNAIEAAGMAAQKGVAAAEMAGTAIEDPERTLKETYLDKMFGVFKNVADKAHKWLRGYAHGLPKDIEYGTTESEMESSHGSIFKERRPWDKPESKTYRQFRDKIENVENALELNKNGASWDLPAYLFQRFYSKPKERKAILLSPSEGDKGATKSENLSRVLERIRSSEHLTDIEVDALIAEIKTFSDAELVSKNPDTKGANTSKETLLSMEFDDRLKKLLEDTITPRLSGKKILSTTVALALTIGGIAYGATTAFKAAAVYKILSKGDGPYIPDNFHLLEDKEASRYLIKQVLNPFVSFGDKDAIKGNGNDMKILDMITKEDVFEYAWNIWRSNKILNSGTA